MVFVPLPCPISKRVFSLPDKARSATSWDEKRYLAWVSATETNKAHAFEIAKGVPELRGDLSTVPDAQNIGENMIACVDADYDYLLQGTTPLSDEVNNNPYVFHTDGLVVTSSERGVVPCIR